MLRNVNPFKPGAGRVPPELVGRDALLREMGFQFAEVLEQSEGARPTIITGLRGVGKTVLLNEFMRIAQDSPRWIAVKLEVVRGADLRVSLGRALYVELRKLVAVDERLRRGLKRFLGTFKAFQLRIDPSGTYVFGFDVSASQGIADSGEAERDLAELMDCLGSAARDLDMAVFIGVDELQDASPADLNALNVALHSLGQSPRPVPLIFFGAGLPSLPTVLADATSYAERLYDYRKLELLTDAETASALLKPSEREGVLWDDGAIELALGQIGGYPYFVQAAGRHIWNARTVEDRIQRDDVTVGLAFARDEVDRGLYESRWERATPAQREFMRAMAIDRDAPSAIQDLVVRTGKSRTSDLSVSRRELIANGHIYAPDRGFVAFTIPGMADYIQRSKSD